MSGSGGVGRGVLGHKIGIQCKSNDVFFQDRESERVARNRLRIELAKGSMHLEIEPLPARWRTKSRSIHASRLRVRHSHSFL